MSVCTGAACVCLFVASSLDCACRDIVPKHRRLAEITEMIHTASLVHDDVLDECDTRRGKAAKLGSQSKLEASCCHPAGGQGCFLSC